MGCKYSLQFRRPFAIRRDLRERNNVQKGDEPTVETGLSPATHLKEIPHPRISRSIVPDNRTKPRQAPSTLGVMIAKICLWGHCGYLKQFQAEFFWLRGSFLLAYTSRTARALRLEVQRFPRGLFLPA